MRSGQNFERFIYAALIFVLALLAVLFIFSGEKNRNGQEEKTEKNSQTNQKPPGYTVTISEEQQRTDGIMTVALKPGLYQKQVAAYGEVLAPEGLSALYKNYIAATSGLEKAKAQLKASKLEYDRLKILNASDKNISDRELQAAASRFAADQAEETSAYGTLLPAKNAVLLKWGPLISGWVFGYKPPLRRIIETTDVLVQVTVPPSATFKGIAEHIILKSPNGAAVSATFISRATSTNPALQGISFIYIASSHNGFLVPGMNVTAQMPAAGAQTGFFIPASAVVWLQDKAWVYVKKSATGFSRVEVPTSISVNNGFFVSGIFASGDQVVTKGAQALLSEESTPKVTGGGEEEDED